MLKTVVDGKSVYEIRHAAVLDSVLKAEEEFKGALFKVGGSTIDVKQFCVL